MDLILVCEKHGVAQAQAHSGGSNQSPHDLVLAATTMSMSPPPSYPDPLMEVSQQPTTMASQPESESQQPSTMTSQPESESRHMQGPFKPVEAQFLENYLEAYLTFDTSDSKKGTKKTWVKNNVFSKYTQHFKSEEPGGPNLESLEKVRHES